MYENKNQPLAPTTIFYKRIRYNVLLGSVIIIVSLSIGVLGYKYTVPEFDWYDSLFNASMILSGMGPVFDSKIIFTKAAKLFASFYALFSGITFLSTFSVLIAPILHRFFHKLHLDESDD